MRVKQSKYGNSINLIPLNSNNNQNCTNTARVKTKMSEKIVLEILQNYILLIFLENAFNTFNISSPSSILTHISEPLDNAGEERIRRKIFTIIKAH